MKVKLKIGKEKIEYENIDDLLKDLVGITIEINGSNSERVLSPIHRATVEEGKVVVNGVSQNE